MHTIKKKGFRIGHRLIALIIVSSFSLVLIGGYSIYNLRNDLFDQKQLELKHVIETATAVADEYYRRAQAGELDDAEAQTHALDALRAYRYGDGDYLFVHDINSVMIMHPIKPSLEGKDLSKLEDKNGKQIFTAFVNVVKENGGGFVDYLWPKPNFEDPVEKLSYVQSGSNWGWIIGTGVYMDDFNSALQERIQFLVIIMIAALILTIFISITVTRSIINPLSAMTKTMRDLAQGDIETQVPTTRFNDEIAEMAETIQVFKDNAHQVKKLSDEREETERKNEEEKRKAMVDLADRFEDEVKGIVQTVSAAATEMRSTSEGMQVTAGNTSEQAVAVTSASEQASGNVQTVASAAEELSSSISEISRQVSHSTSITNEAVNKAEEANKEVTGLLDASQKIGEVISLISDIAEQTNLLALNATIEAARAGDAGKGFAVVASEVKNLATQTAKATEDISKQIEGIQGATDTAAGAIGSITGTIEQINEITSSVAAAVEEQGAATLEISRNVQEAAAATSQVSSTINDVTGGVEETGRAAQDVLGAASELSQQSEMLNIQVDSFIHKIREA
ncbi:methyl-accepting chemotaxis protein [Kiloniella majae]|uniref:methyl-accepting chemotaxis protein n=1 Tax=Kiloniella majae TaxID=1938558 RepID=UPI000A2795F5|nr:cache domain-containing protein [Kiloniella majae]